MNFATLVSMKTTKQKASGLDLVIMQYLLSNENRETPRTIYEIVGWNI